MSIHILYIIYLLALIKYNMQYSIYHLYINIDVSVVVVVTSSSSSSESFSSLKELIRFINNVLAPGYITPE